MIIHEPPMSPEFVEIEGVYQAMDSSEVTKKWHICVAFPHVKDPIYIAYTYGSVTEARRLGAKATIVAANGYGDLETHISQIENCVAQGVDALAIVAISPEALTNVIDEARANGTVVIDCGIGINAATDGEVIESFNELGTMPGEYLKAKHPKGSGKVKLLWLPGPAGILWVEDATRAFKDTLVDSDVEIVKVMYGDSGKVPQMKLVEDGVQTYSDISYLAGGAPAIEVAVQHLREIGREDIKLIAFYTSPGVVKAVEQGRVEATLMEDSVILLRMCVDMAGANPRGQGHDARCGAAFPHAGPGGTRHLGARDLARARRLEARVQRRLRAFSLRRKENREGRALPGPLCDPRLVDG